MGDISEIARVPVSPGFTWTSVFTGGTFVALIGVVSLIIRHIGPWRKQRDEAEQNLREALTKRVDKLEKTLEQERARHEAEIALHRHKANNLAQCLDAVLMVLEAAPERTVEVVAKVRAMREAQKQGEAAEAAAIHAAQITIKSVEASA